MKIYDHTEERSANLNQPVTVVLVGIGGYGALYVDEILNDCDKGLCELVGVVDPAAEKSPKYQKITERNIPVFQQIEEFYREHTAQLCCIAAPIPYHTPYTAYALDHGSCVLCEKPLSGDWMDGYALEALAEKNHAFVMSGYQWSYSSAILDLKRDILSGKFGAPKHLRTKILWPRCYSYFCRGSGWAGKRVAEDGTSIYDSVANNACAHYLHNILFLLGDAMNTAALPTTMEAELFRVNPIENFDTCVLRMHFENGADALFLATHATEENEDPVFIYTFEKGTVSFSQEGGEGVVARMDDGSMIKYGNPFADQMNKVRIAIEAVRHAEKRAELPCTARTAMAQARCIYAIRNVPIVDVPEELMEIKVGGTIGADSLRVIRQLHEALNRCYQNNCMISELEDDEAIQLLKNAAHHSSDLQVE